MPLVRVNRQLMSFDEPKIKPTPPATLQVSEPTLAPDRPLACGVPGVAGVCENPEVTAVSSRAAPLVIARTDRSMAVLLFRLRDGDTLTHRLRGPKAGSCTKALSPCLWATLRPR